MKMGFYCGIAIAMALTAGCRSGDRNTFINFEDAALGQVPPRFETALTGQGREGKWIVVEDSAAPSGKKVLAQMDDDPTNGRYPVCVFGAVALRDVEVSVHFKPVSGKVDQGAGIVVRYQDKDNYYIARANALEDNVRLYKVVNGKRIQFAGIDIKAPSSNQWHELSLAVVGDRFDVSMNQKHLFAAYDKTFQGAGKVGLWTKADSVTYFDDFAIIPHETTSSSGGK